MVTSTSTSEPSHLKVTLLEHMTLQQRSIGGKRCAALCTCAAFLCVLTGLAQALDRSTSSFKQHPRLLQAVLNFGVGSRILQTGRLDGNSSAASFASSDGVAYSSSSSPANEDVISPCPNSSSAAPSHQGQMSGDTAFSDACAATGHCMPLPECTGQSAAFAGAGFSSSHAEHFRGIVCVQQQDLLWQPNAAQTTNSKANAAMSQPIIASCQDSFESQTAQHGWALASGACSNATDECSFRDLASEAAFVMSEVSMTCLLSFKLLSGRCFV